MTTTTAHTTKPAFLGWNSQDLVMRYYHNSDMQLQWAISAFSKFGKLSGDEQILDYGSGDGKISALISNFVPRGSLTAVDLSHHMSEFASNFYDQGSYPNLSFHVLNDPNFDTWDGPHDFDLATSFCMLHLAQQPQKILKNICRRLKPNGHFVATWPIGLTEEATRDLIGVAKDHGISIPLPENERLLMQKAESIPKMLNSAGFDVESCNVVMTHNPFLNKQELVDWYIGTLSANWDVPVEKRAAFFHDLADKHISLEQHKWTSGLVYQDFPRIDIIAKPKK